MVYIITRVSENNIRDAAAVYMSSWIESHREICSAEFIEKHDFKYMLNYIKGKIDNNYDIFIDYKDNKPVGIVGINPFDEEICLLYVDPERQEKGVGTELLEFAVSKCQRPYIIVLDTNTKAIDFYKKRGFIPAEVQTKNSENKRIFERKYVYQNKNM